MKVSFVVPGDPVGKQRPRMNTRSHRTYTPAKTRAYEAHVRDCYDSQCGKRCLEGGIAVEIEACFSIPKSVSKKKRGQMLRGEIKCTKKPDLDNIAKSILDSVNGMAYQDDSQVVMLSIRKRYAEEPMVITTLEEINEQQSDES